MKKHLMISISFNYELANGEKIEMLVASYYCDEIIDSGLYFEVMRDGLTIGLIFKNGNYIIKADGEIIYE